MEGAFPNSKTENDPSTITTTTNNNNHNNTNHNSTINHKNDRNTANQSNQDTSNKSGDKKETRIKKRKYSRGGCEECKRRKMKCDEGKPYCHNCSRLNKTCIYRDKQRFRFEPVADPKPEPYVPSQPATGPQNLPFRFYSPKGPEEYEYYGGVPGGVPAGTPTGINNINNIPTGINNGTNGTNGTNGIPASAIGPAHHGAVPPGSPLGLPHGLPGLSLALAQAPHGYVPRKNLFAPGQFSNTIPDILASPISNTPKHEMRSLFDKASLLVNDINDLVALDIPSEWLDDLATTPAATTPAATTPAATAATATAATATAGAANSEVVAANSANSGTGANGGNGAHSTALSAAPGSAPPLALDNGSYRDSERLVHSESYEKHNFRVDELASQFIGHDISPIDFNSPFQLALPDFVLSDFDNSVTNTSLIDQVIHTNKLREPHITYLKVITNTQLSYHLFPFASSVESNQVVRLLLQYLIDCPYLLTSLLMWLATFQYNQSGKQIHDISRRKYASVCLRSLSEVFGAARRETESKPSPTPPAPGAPAASMPAPGTQRLETPTSALAPPQGPPQGPLPGPVRERPRSTGFHLKDDIEKLLLTILVHTSSFTATAQSDDSRTRMLNSWKVHLRGAKDLLTQYNSLKMSFNRPHVSGGLALAKTWFFAMESIASLNSNLGGILKHSELKDDSDSDKNPADPHQDSDTDLHENFRVYSDTAFFSRDLNPDYHDTLVKIGLLIPAHPGLQTPFNLFLGYLMRYVRLSQEFAKALKYVRLQPGKAQVSAAQVCKLMAMIHDARKTEIIPHISHKTYAVPVTSPGHPDFPDPSGYHPKFPASAYTKIVDHDGATHYYSWLDLSEHIRIDTLYLRMLTTHGLLRLEPTHPLVQEIVDRSLNSCFFILSKSLPLYALHRDNILVETTNYYLTPNVFDVRATMIQSAFRVCSNLIQTEHQFEKVELYFLGLIKLGNGSSLAALDLLYKIRDRAKQRAEGKEVLPGEDVDDLDAIPFA